MRVVPCGAFGKLFAPSVLGKPYAKIMFSFEPQHIPEVILVRPRLFSDSRGFFKEQYKASLFQTNGINAYFMQDNHSRSSHATLRGLHYQLPPKAQAKLVSVIRGRVLDVALDIRQGSPTYGQHVAVELSDENHCQLYIPVGFAHGFVVLSDSADFYYKVSADYSPEHDRGIRWNDPALQIDWRISSPLLSPKDAQQPLLEDAENTFIYQEHP